MVAGKGKGTNSPSDSSEDEVPSEIVVGVITAPEKVYNGVVFRQIRYPPDSACLSGQDCDVLEGAASALQCEVMGNRVIITKTEILK